MLMRFHCFELDPGMATGHMLGHALETATDYDLLHGKAVAIGVAVEVRAAALIERLRPGRYSAQPGNGDVAHLYGIEWAFTC
jgi:hypothetical protein